MDSCHSNLTKGAFGGRCGFSALTGLFSSRMVSVRDKEGLQLWESPEVSEPAGLGWVPMGGDQLNLPTF